MTLFALLIVLAIEFHFKVGSEYRKFEWFKKIIRYFDGSLGNKAFYQSWWQIGIILLLPIFFLIGITSLFDGFIYQLVLFVMALPLLFLSLGPVPLEQSFADYFAAMKRADTEAAVLHLNEMSGGKDADTLAPMEKDELVRAATKQILTEAQNRYFGPIIWFIFTGPFGALFFRLCYQYQDYCQDNQLQQQSAQMKQVIHWIGWLPARFTSLFFLLTGDFAKGLYPIQDYLLDADADNDLLVSETGIAALGLDMGVSDESNEENYRAWDIVIRTSIFYLVFAAVVSIL